MSIPHSQHTILISDDHEMILNALELLLNDHPSYRIIGKANTILSLKEHMNRLRPDILILDLNFSRVNILDQLDQIKELSHRTRILILSSYDSPSLVKEAFAKGVDGYLLKDTSKEELWDALDKIVIGEKIIGESVQQFDISRNFIDTEFVQRARITPRELEVIRMLIEGKNETEIGQYLSISKYTVHDHKKNIFRKLQIQSTSALIKYAYEKGLFGSKG